MPFPDPPVPSSFDVGLINGGHAHFDQNGVTFYDTDGVTQVLHMDFATGLLTIGPSSGKRLVIDPTDAAPLQFYSGKATATTPAEIFSQQNSNTDTWFYLQGEDWGSAQGPAWFGIHTGSGGTYFTWGLDQGFGPSMTYDANGNLRLDPGAGNPRHFQCTRNDGATVTVPGMWNTAINTGMDGGGQTANVIDASGDVNYTHGLGLTPNFVICQSNDASAWMTKLGATSSAGFTLQVRNSAGAFPASGTGITIKWLAAA